MPHQAHRRPAGPRPAQGGRRGRRHPRRPAASGCASRRSTGFGDGKRPGAGRHRRRRPRPPHRRRRDRRALRPARGPQDLPAPLGPHRPGRRGRAGRDACCSGTRSCDIKRLQKRIGVDAADRRDVLERPPPRRPRPPGTRSPTAAHPRRAPARSPGRSRELWAESRLAVRASAHGSGCAHGSAGGAGFTVTPPRGRWRMRGTPRTPMQASGRHRRAPDAAAHHARRRCGAGSVDGPGRAARCAVAGWRRLRDGLYVLPGSVPSWERDAIAGCLLAGADARGEPPDGGGAVGLVPRADAAARDVVPPTQSHRTPAGAGAPQPRAGRSTGAVRHGIRVHVGVADARRRAPAASSGRGSSCSSTTRCARQVASPASVLARGGAGRATRSPRAWRRSTRVLEVWTEDIKPGSPAEMRLLRRLVDLGAVGVVTQHEVRRRGGRVRRSPRRRHPGAPARLRVRLRPLAQPAPLGAGRAPLRPARGARVAGRPRCASSTCSPSSTRLEPSCSIRGARSDGAGGERVAHDGEGRAVGHRPGGQRQADVVRRHPLDPLGLEGVGGLADVLGAVGEEGGERGGR